VVWLTVARSDPLMLQSLVMRAQWAREPEEVKHLWGTLDEEDFAHCFVRL
jgi:hypothetical protein